MGMQLEDMKRYSQLDPSQRVESVLPGSHPPVKGFYLIKPSPVIASSKSLNRSPSLLTRLRNPKRSSSTHSLVLSPSISEFDALSGNLEGEALESSLHSHVSSDPAQKDASEVVSGNLEAEVLKSSLQSREKADPAQEGASEAVVDVDEIPLAH